MGRLAVMRWSSCWSRISVASQIGHGFRLLVIEHKNWMFDGVVRLVYLCVFLDATREG